MTYGEVYRTVIKNNDLYDLIKYYNRYSPSIINFDDEYDERILNPFSRLGFLFSFDRTKEGPSYWAYVNNYFSNEQGYTIIYEWKHIEEWVNDILPFMLNDDASYQLKKMLDDIKYIREMHYKHYFASSLSMALYLIVYLLSPDCVGELHPEICFIKNHNRLPNDFDDI